MHLGWQWVRFPGCFFTRPQQLIYDALLMGYDGIQMIPVRGASGNEDGVLLWEKAWNPVNSLLKTLAHKRGASGMPSEIADWVVSPSIHECTTISDQLQTRNLQQICHHPLLVPAGCLVEVNPDNRTTAARYITHMQSGHLRGFVIDTHHLRRESRHHWSNPLMSGNDDWHLSVETLAPHTKAIHLHPRDVEAFLEDPTGSVEAEIVRHILQFGSTDKMIMVAEYEPPKKALGKAHASQLLAKTMLSAMELIVDRA